jgi:hypothetical protein
MFILAPGLVVEPNESQIGPARVDTALPAQFVEETLRVAVYVEDDTSLPAYAEGGVYTAHYANVIQFLEAEGFSVTPITTQDILDRQLLAARFDAFVLPNQLPRDNIINHVKDYWLAGGGILSIGNSLGYLLYMGMIAPSLEGDFGWVLVGPPDYYLYQVPYDEIRILERHPVTKAFEVDDMIPYTDNTTVWNWAGLTAMIGDSFHHLAKHEGVTENGAIFALDNPNRGGRIVQIPGNCSEIPAWQHPLYVDGIDWLAARPKGKIAIDFTHVPYYGVDVWDLNVTHKPRYTEFRNFAVNHSFTFDKLYPKGTATLTGADIAPYDILILNLPTINYTSAEIAVIKSWVEDGGGLYVMADFVLPTGQQNLNELMGYWGLAISQGTTNLPSSVTSEFDAHPILEGVASLSFHNGEYLNVSGGAYPIASFGPNIAVAGAEPSHGRVILAGDINFLSYEYIAEGSNIEFSINLLNWLSATTAKVLVYADTSSNTLNPNYIPLKSPVAQALNDLDIEFFITSNGFYFNMSLFRDDWDMVVFDNNNHGTTSYQLHLIDFVEGGGKVVLSTWGLNVATGVYFGVEVSDWLHDPPVVHLWEPDHPIFNLPAPYGATTLETTLDLGFGTDALNFTTFANATPLAGYSAAPAGAAIVLGAGGNVIVNGPLIVSYADDFDNSTYPDNVEIWENEIAFLYFDRPTIDHPADVNYMETETGNEITWTPTADAGPWEYVFSVNGTPTEGGRWTGGSLTFNVDGVNASITEYEITVFDRLGYVVADLVILNVTEYVEPPGPGGPGIDPMLLIIIGAAVGGLLIVLVVLWKLKKK